MQIPATTNLFLSQQTEAALNASPEARWNMSHVPQKYAIGHEKQCLSIMECTQDIQGYNYG